MILFHQTRSDKEVTKEPLRFLFAKPSGLEIPKMEILVSGIEQSEARVKEHEYINQYNEIGYKDKVSARLFAFLLPEHFRLQVVFADLMQQFT